MPSYYLLCLLHFYVLDHSDPQIVADEIGGLEITIIVTIVVACVCVSLVVVVVSRCVYQAKHDRGNSTSDESSRMATPINIVTLPQEDKEKEKGSVAWQDLPNCYVPESCTASPKKKSVKESASYIVQPTPSSTPSRPITLKPQQQGGSTPDTTANQSDAATDLDSVFCTVTPMQALSLRGDSPPQTTSQSGTPILLSSHLGANKSNRLSAGQVSLDGPEYALQRGTSERASTRSANNTLGRPLNPSPLSTDRSPVHAVRAGAVLSGTTTSTASGQNLAMYPGSLTPGWPTVVTSNGVRLQTERRMHGPDDQYRHPEDDQIHLLYSSTPSYGNPSPNTTMRGRSNTLPYPDLIYSYDSLKAEVDSLRRKASARQGSSVDSRQQSALHTADV
eukprot:scpid67387/ scgid2324/ 